MFYFLIATKALRSHQAGGTFQQGFALSDHLSRIFLCAASEGEYVFNFRFCCYQHNVVKETDLVMCYRNEHQPWDPVAT